MAVKSKITFVAMALICLTFFSCSTAVVVDRSTPDKVVAGFYDAMLHRSYDKMVDYIYLEERDDMMLEVKASELKHDFDMFAKDNGYLAEYQIKRIILDDQHNRAKARVSIRYDKDSKPGTKTLYLTKDKDQWYINF